MRILLLLLLLTACSTAHKSANTLRISFNTQPATFDPTKAGDFVSSTLVCMIYEGLTRCLPGGDVEPALAESVDISNDQTVYTFHMRKAYWSNGKPITAHDFERSWKTILSPPSLCAYLFYPIKNAEKCVKGEVSIEEVGIHALNDSTLRIELQRPTPYFYSLTAFPSFLAEPSLPNTFSGPFFIEKMVNNSEIILTKNPTYWNRNAIHLDQVHISIVADETTAFQMFERGDLDWLGGSLSPLPPDALEKLRGQLTFIPSAATTLCTFNTQIAPFDNLHLRKAFSYAIDRSEIVEKITQAGQIPASSMLPPNFSSQSLPFFDPILAREHLAKSEVDPTQIELVLYYKPSQLEKRLAQTLQRQWKEALGITVQLIQLDFKSHAQRLHNRDYQIALASWIAQFDDPISILERFKDRSNHKNYPGWEDPLYAQLINEQNLTAAEERFADQMPLTPIYHWSSPALCGSRIEATAATPCGGVLFERFKLTR